MNNAFEIRRCGKGDLEGVLALLRSSLGWGDDSRYRELFAWKHERGAFGSSPAWIALDGDRIAGFRVLLRWEFEHESTVIRAVRPVDTATDPEYQGRGVFTALTRHALDAVRDEGTTLVFNTPNDQSRPGYLKMGWQVVGKLGIAARPTRPWRMMQMLSARTPADRWSLDSHSGVPVSEILADRTDVQELLVRRGVAAGLRTRITPEYLTWRYGEPLLGYRAIVAADGIASGLVIFRVRRRGRAREAALCEILVPDDSPHARRHLVQRAVRSVDADYLLTIRAPGEGGAGLWPVPRQGPVLTARSLDGAPSPHRDAWALTLGDVELF